MKGLIITLTGNYNYGNRLQNYALQETLENQGLEVETYNNVYKSIETDSIKKKTTPMNISRIIKGIKARLKHNKRCELDIIRTENIKQFTNKYIKMSVKQKSELNGNYDYFILGSDQIWNPDFTNDFDLNLGFVGSGKNIISYAASFGVDKINTKLIDLYKKAFLKMKAISVREKKGEELVKLISGKDSKTVLDPTMLLTADKWRKMEKKPTDFSNEKYILVYCVADSEKIINKYINKIVKDNCLKVINLTNKNSKEYTSGIEEFLYYIDNAEKIITDSFHACVFSILFKKNFYIMKRKNNQKGMNSRIDTLLGTFKIQNRDIKKIKIDNKCDYSKLDEILKIERNKSLGFIRNALGKE